MLLDRLGEGGHHLIFEILKQLKILLSLCGCVCGGVWVRVRVCGCVGVWVWVGSVCVLTIAFAWRRSSFFLS